MNFSVHLNDELIERLNQTVRESGKTRNALIREAVGEWLDRRRPAKWPAEVTNFRGVRGIKRFEPDRKKLKLFLLDTCVVSDFAQGQPQVCSRAGTASNDASVR